MADYEIWECPNIHCTMYGEKLSYKYRGTNPCCKVCGNVMIPASGNTSSDSGVSSDTIKGFGYLAALILGYTLIFFPGAMITMLFNNWIDFEPGWGQWFCGVGMSLLVFLFCGFNWKKYLVLDIILVSICSIIGWLSSFSPWAFAAKTLMPMWFD